MHDKLIILFLLIFAFPALAETPLITCSGSNFLQSTASPPSFSCAAPAGSGTVTTTGTPASGNLTKFSGTTSITNGDISGDCTTSGALALTCGYHSVTGALKSNGSGTVSQAACGDLSDSGTACTAVAPANTTATTSNFFTAYTAATGAFSKAQPAFSDISGQAANAQLATQTANTVLGALTATTPSGLALPSCADTSGNHLNYTSGTGFSCGTSDAHVGTVTSIATTSPITGGTITSTGTIACATCATTTNGGALSGTAPIAVSVSGVISGGGLGTVTGALKGNGSGTITQAACADLSNGGTACTKNTGTSGANVPLLNGVNTWGAGQIATQSTPAISTATFTPDFSAGNHFIIGLVHASCPCTLANPTNIVAGQSGVIALVQSATGSDTITTWGTDYIFTNSASPTLSTAANAIDYLSYYVEDSTHIRANFIPASPQAEQVGGFISNQTKFTTTGCSISSTTGGATAGKFTLGANTCTAVITMNGATGLTAPNGWSCWAADQTAPTILVEQSASTATTASLSVPAGAGATDVISFGCIGY